MYIMKKLNSSPFTCFCSVLTYQGFYLFRLITKNFFKKSSLQLTHYHVIFVSSQTERTTHRLVSILQVATNETDSKITPCNLHPFIGQPNHYLERCVSHSNIQQQSLNYFKKVVDSVTTSMVSSKQVKHLAPTTQYINLP